MQVLGPSTIVRRPARIHTGDRIFALSRRMQDLHAVAHALDFGQMWGGQDALRSRPSSGQVADLADLVVVETDGRLVENTTRGVADGPRMPTPADKPWTACDQLFSDMGGRNGRLPTAAPRVVWARDAGARQGRCTRAR